MHESWIKEEIVFVLHSINDALIVFFRGQVLVAMCVGGLLMIGFWLIGLSYAVLLGFVAGILGIVPYLGVMLSIVPALIISMVENPGWAHPALTLGVFVLVQMAEGLVISPRIIGDRVGMHPLTVIIAIMIGTTLMGGIIGGVLAIPLTAALRTLMFRYVWTESPSPFASTRQPLPTTLFPTLPKFRGIQSGTFKPGLIFSRLPAKSQQERSWRFGILAPEDPGILASAETSARQRFSTAASDEADFSPSDEHPPPPSPRRGWPACRDRCLRKPGSRCGSTPIRRAASRKISGAGFW